MCGPLGKFSGYIVLSSLILSTIQVCMLVLYIKLFLGLGVDCILKFKISRYGSGGSMYLILGYNV